jgi:putative ABC transport system permease protein
MHLLVLILKNLRRNWLRSALTSLAVVFLVAIFSMIYSVLEFLNQAMAEKPTDIPLVVTERYRLPSRFDRSLFDQITGEGTDLNKQLRQIPGFKAESFNVWHFIGFTLDPTFQDKDLQFFLIATYPDKIKTMIDSMEELDPKLCELMKNPPGDAKPNTGILLGPDRLQKLRKKVGDKFPAISMSHRGNKDGIRKPIEMEFVIVGELPAGSRWVQGAFADYAYIERVLKEQKSEMDGKINLGWLNATDKQSAGQVSAAIEGYIKEVKCEQASSAVSRFLESYQSMLWGVKWVLIPAIVGVMSLIVANAISITVRERVTEIAVLKVLGFRPGQILGLILGEGTLLGLVGSLFATTVTFVLINKIKGGINLPIAFFPVFFVPAEVFILGPLLGVLTACAGGFVPAWLARGIKVSEVFAKVA